jgi:hypothetical protein
MGNPAPSQQAPTWRRRALVGSVALVTASGAALSLGASPAAAAPPQWHVTKVLSSKFVGPLQFAVWGSRFRIADAFTSSIDGLNGKAVAHGFSAKKGGDVGGVALNLNRGELAYTSSNKSHSKTTLTVIRHHKKVLVVDLAAFERKNNPDHIRTYGVLHPSACVRNVLNKAHIPVKYKGAVDSHPYAVASLGGGNWAVADAGGNDILRVSASGAVSVMSVMPRIGWKISKAFAQQNHLPNCVVGVTYYVEAVPTDVEARGHKLYVSTLPGAEAAHLGRIYSIDRRSLKRTMIGHGFNLATNLAVSKSGTVYVAELGSGRISQLVHGRGVKVASVPNVVAVEYANGHLYASTAPAVNGAHAPGQILQLGR